MPRRGGLVLVVPAVAGAVLLLVVTRHGAYLSPDALAYVGTARNLLDGHGYTPPPGSPAVGNFPPLFPLALAAAGALGPDPLTVARFLNPLVFGATICVVGLLARRLSGSVPLALAAQLLVLSGTDFLAYHSAALSEPLFLLLTLCALVAVAGVGAEQWSGRPLLLGLAALAAASACLTRYVGVALVAAGALALAARRKWAGAAAFTLLAMAPVVAWIAWLWASAGQASNREAVLHPPAVSYFAKGVGNATAWFLPQELIGPVRAALAAAVLVVVTAVGWRARSHRSGERWAAAVVAIFAAVYLAALVVDRFLFDVTGRLDDRFLLPLHAVAVGLAVFALRGVDLGRSRLARLGLCAVVGIHLLSGGFWVRDALRDREVRPGGFAAPSWTTSEVIDQVRALPASTPVYTNEVDALFFHTGRVATPVPEQRLLLTGRANPAYGAQLADMADGLRRGGLLAYFTASPARRVFLPPPWELAEQLGLQSVSHDHVGVLYRTTGLTP